MPKRHQQRPAKESAGRNNPEKSTVITTGTSKTQETYKKQIAEHQATDKVAQEAKVQPSRDMTEGRSHEAESQEMAAQGSHRSGSDSNANKHRKGSRVHDNDKVDEQPPPHYTGDEFAHDLTANEFAGENHGVRDPSILEYPRSAMDVKELHTQLADLTDDELKNILIVPDGMHLQQGATYIDLRHLEQGEFVATAEMVANGDHYYVPKKEVDYVLWNRLNQVTEPVRLDEHEL
jgi:hypothetical protein